ncbi:ChbG/HpnK family deacetylase [Collinsella vaginalis]|uniref:ChbG/HpnK family deacetylase n=1 Tax=Collinsella vaginalis TaxID=1870987 RepID=UPI000A26F470|nr:ChbG/HpnK family deacetylase [Collinsella vaginalis]
MKRLLIRADDVGYSYAVDLGIARTVHEGLIRSVGVMPNMPEAEHGASLLAGADIAIGQHTNVCLGEPCADPKRVGSLLDERGRFKSSRTFRAAYKEGLDFVDYDEAVIEAEAQLERFLQIVGREPDYFEAHAVMSESLNRAIEDVALSHGFRFHEPSFDPTATIACGEGSVRMVMHSMQPGYEPAEAIRQTVGDMADGETVIFVCHPGYLDRFILEHSSLTTDRTKEVDALIDPGLRTWLDERTNLELIDYRDL